jgi:hypothetical protein
MTNRSPLPDDHPGAVLARRVAHLCNVVRLRLAAGAIVAENAIHVRALRTTCDRFLAVAPGASCCQRCLLHSYPFGTPVA